MSLLNRRTPIGVFGVGSVLLVHPVGIRARRDGSETCRSVCSELSTAGGFVNGAKEQGLLETVACPSDSGMKCGAVNSLLLRPNRTMLGLFKKPNNHGNAGLT